MRNKLLIWPNGGGRQNVCLGIPSSNSLQFSSDGLFCTTHLEIFVSGACIFRIFEHGEDKQPIFQKHQCRYITTSSLIYVIAES